MVESFYFGSGAPRLFGSYQAPVGTQRAHAMLLCPALGHEYVQCHFAYRLLASRLAEAGFPVLRFEYRGLGNAEGSLAEASLEDWVLDAARALEELARRSGAAWFCVGGIRLGATLSALAAGCNGAIDAALLWDPVTRGCDYVRELTARQARFIASLRSPAFAVAAGDDTEILGFALPRALMAELAAIDPRRLGRCLTGKRVLLLEDCEPRTDPRVLQSLATGCAALMVRDEPGPEAWLETPQRIMQPGKSLEEIAAWMENLG